MKWKWQTKSKKFTRKKIFVSIVHVPVLIRSMSLKINQSISTEEGIDICVVCSIIIDTSAEISIMECMSSLIWTVKGFSSESSCWFFFLIQSNWNDLINSFVLTQIFNCSIRIFELFFFLKNFLIINDEMSYSIWLEIFLLRYISCICESNWSKNLIRKDPCMR